MSTLKSMISTAEGLATTTGVAILAATTNANVLQTGGWFTSHALVVGTLSAGVFAGARVVGFGAGKIGLVIVGALLAGEAYNFSATAERIVVERENGAAPLKDALAKHNQAVARLQDLESSEIGSARLTLAKQAKAQADAAVEAEAREGGCKSVCRMKQAEADKAQAELQAAIADAESQHAAEIDAARAEVEANPLPASATPLADRLGWAPWVLDLLVAGLLSIGANGLAGTLIAFGAHSAGGNADNAQTAFNPMTAENVVRFFRPDRGNGYGGSGYRPSPKPGPAGPTGLSKEQALADILDRLGQGVTIPSQDTLASDWNRPKQTVSDWMKEWRRIGIVPPPTRTGRCKATVAG